MVIAGIPPAKLAVQERSKIYRDGKEQRSEARRELYAEWQNTWRNYEGWARWFVVDIKKWCERRWGELEYFSVQAMTGHGVFGEYLKRIGRAESDTCWFCPERDTPEHTVFGCTRFREMREECESKIGNVRKENIAEKLLESEKNWVEITGMLKQIMMVKDAEEKRRETERRTAN